MQLFVNKLLLLIIVHTLFHLQTQHYVSTRKITPLHRRRLYTHNLNGIDLQKLHNLSKIVSLLNFLQQSLFRFITCNF